MPEKISSGKRIAKNTLLLYTRMLLTMGVSLYTSRVALDVLGVADYGLYNVVGGIVLVFSILNGALSSGSSRFITYELGRGILERQQKTFATSFMIHSGAAAVVLLLAETVGLWYVNNVLVVPEGRLVAANWLYQFSIVSCMLALTQVPYSAAIVAHERMKVYAWVGVADAVFKLAVVIGLYYAASIDKLILYGIMCMVWSVMQQVYYRFYCRKNFPECRLSLVRDKSYFKSMLSFSLWDIFGSLCTLGFTHGLTLLVNVFWGVAVNAAMGIAYQVENALCKYMNGFMTAVQPQIVKLYAAGQFDNMRKLVHNASKYSYILLLTLNLPFFIKAHFILDIWLKEVPQYSVIFLQWALMCRLVRAFATPVVQAIHATGKIKRLNLWAGIPSICLNLPSIFVAYKLGAPPFACYVVLFCTSVLGNFIELKVLSVEMEFSIIRYLGKVYVIGAIVTLVTGGLAFTVNHFMPEETVASFAAICVTVIISNAFMALYVASDRETRQTIYKAIGEKLHRKKAA